MAALMLVGTLIGAVLGTRYRVLVLVPTTLLLVAAAAITAGASGASPGTALVHCVGIVVTVQFGYAAALGLSTWSAYARLRSRQAGRRRREIGRGVCRAAVAGPPPGLSTDIER